MMVTENLHLVDVFPSVTKLELSSEMGGMTVQCCARMSVSHRNLIPSPEDSS